MIYLDNAATTKLDAEVLEAMMPYLTGQYGNPNTLYSLGRNAREAVENARAQVAAMIGANPEQIIFTSGGTEGNNTVIYGLRSYLEKTGKTHIITSMAEHDSVYRPILDLSDRYGFDVTYLPVLRNGRVDIPKLEDSITPRTGLVSLMCVNNETGIGNIIPLIGMICKRHGILLHTDCVQAAGWYNIKVDTYDCDFLTISSHKINGPKGVGALYARDPSLLDPLIIGGHTQEFGLRGGTENVANIVGFGVACRNVITVVANDDASFFEQCLHETGIDYVVNSATDKILNIRFDGVDAQSLVLMLDTYGVCVSAGSACRSEGNEPSRTLIACGLTEQEAKSSIRISFSRESISPFMLEDAAKTIAHCVRALRELGKQ